MSIDTKQYSRSVYSILNFLGDVGGLLSILLPIGSGFIALLDSLFERTLDEFLIAKVFLRSKELKESEQNIVASKRNQ